MVKKFTDSFRPNSLHFLSFFLISFSFICFGQDFCLSCEIDSVLNIQTENVGEAYKKSGKYKWKPSLSMTGKLLPQHLTLCKVGEEIKVEGDFYAMTSIDKVLELPSHNDSKWYYITDEQGSTLIQICRNTITVSRTRILRDDIFNFAPAFVMKGKCHKK